MRIHQILGEPSVIITNEERNFIFRNSPKISISKLIDRDEVIARNLVRKGVYEVSEDSESIVLKVSNTHKRLI
jgi:hypothetical protein